MRIKELELFNIRSHKLSRIRLNDGITVLSGRTGSGKSSFLMSVEYALFGADNKLTNQAVLRRNAKQGHVRVVFEKQGVEYEVMRGLEKKGSSIIVDPDKLWVKVQGKKLPLIARTGEVNQKIIELLKYPTDVKPKELFEITAYAKQDEIRKLIELTNENRQRYIDRVLQLSKYQLTWENMKDLINELRTNAGELKVRIEGLESLNQELKDKKAELSRRKGELKSNKAVLKSLGVELNRLKSLIIDKNETLEKLEEKNKDFEIKKSQLESLEERKDLLSCEIISLKNELKSKPAVKINLESLVEQKSSIKQSIKHKQELINNLTNELEQVSSLKSACPLCKQGITDDHKNSIKKRYDDEINELRNRLSGYSSKLMIVEKELIKAQANKQLIDQLIVKQGLFDDKSNKLIELNNSLKQLRAGLKSAKMVNTNALKKELEGLMVKDKELSGNFKAINEKNKLLTELINGLESSVADKKLEVDKLKNDKERLVKLEQKLNLINRLRDDIRNIREVVRAKFLEDFRQEFQNKYEEIRSDDDYSVEIMNDYEPVAYSNGVETPVSNLSGGEKTSVALAYRLALSEIAARLSDVEQSELLILDEPTTGFDRNDVKALPGTLKSIKTIPQIIIVSHVDELKEAADKIYEVNKSGGASVVS